MLSFEYSEHVGIYLQRAGIIGEIKDRYIYIIDNNNIEINLLIIYYLNELKMILLHLQLQQKISYYLTDKLLINLF